MIEIDLPLEIAIPLLILLLLLAFYLWHYIGGFQSHTEPIDELEYNRTDQTLKERYGAYIQLAGRRYN